MDTYAAAKKSAETATLNFSSSLIFNKEVLNYQSNYAIKTSASLVKIPSGSTVIFTTRNEIELNSGFEVELGGTFTGIVDKNRTVVCE